MSQELTSGTKSGRLCVWFSLHFKNSVYLLKQVSMVAGKETNDGQCYSQFLNVYNFSHNLLTSFPT